MVGLFAPPPSAEDSEREAVKQSLFLQLKAITVPLLDASRSPVSSDSTRTILDLLRRLETILDETPSYAFNPSLANYAFFPLTSLLQPRPDGVNRGDRVLEATMQSLRALVEKWRRAGMEERVRKELWTMTILTLGGPLKSREGSKGKEVDRTEESKLATVQVLEALMKRQEEEEEEEEISADPTSSQDPPSLSILFHTLTTLLALAADPTSLVQLQLSSISALRILTTEYLAPKPCPTPPRPSSLLATALPGMASTLSRIALSKPPSSKISLETPTRKQTSPVVVSALRLLASLVNLSVSDSVTNELRTEGTSEKTPNMSLEELARDLEDSPATLLDDAEPPEPSHTDSTTPPTGPTVPTPAWLGFTISSLSSLLNALSPLTSHHSPDVRIALVELLSEVVRNCSSTFGPSLEGPLEGLLVLSRDEWDIVSSPALQSLLDLLDGSHASPSAPPLLLLGKIVNRRLVSLPLVLRKRDEESIRRSAGIVQTTLDILPVNSNQEELVSNVARWSWNLLGSFELERVVSTRGGNGAGLALAWIKEGVTQTDDEADSFPRLRLRNMYDDSTVRSLDELWSSFGAGAARCDKDDVLLEYFSGVALGPRRGEAVATNALWIVEGILKGLSKLTMDKRRKKLVKGVTRAVIGFLEDLESEEEEQEEEVLSAEMESRQKVDTASLTGSVELDNLPTIQHNKGVTSVPSLAEYKPVVSRTTNSQDRASHRILLLSLSLRTLATSSSLLQSSFRPLLLPSLYHVLAYSSSTSHPFLRSHAQTTLSVIAKSTSFASSQDLVLSNVDYVVNSVSQRMSVTRLDPSAPLVLVEMIRLVGKPIVSIVQDLADDVFEALDDYHGYEDVTVGLWAVLDALLKVMEEDLPKSSDSSSATSTESTFDTFKKWFVCRKETVEQKEEEDEDRNPRKPFESGFKSREEDPAEGSTEFPEESESKQVPATRPQIVTAQILSKSLYFLSHPSPFLRGRVLSLLASAVPLLARPSFESQDRSADLLPIIHRAWPFILNRLVDSDLSVSVEAATLVEALAEHTGEFMSRRILEDVWPRFRTLLAKQELDDTSSALPGSTRYSNSHRLYRSILKTLLDAARHVPLKEDVLWEQAFLLRRFLASSVHEELQDLALKLYRSLGKINKDAVWLVLAGTKGEVEGLPEFLSMDKVQFGGNLDSLLQEL
ncbi:Tti1p [Sporobolomyces salmoneus]|uniref:Tti1p n=1 Tax=Sporobolomyces salmoneus TaxID=183962 RepID=UPI0031769D08